MSGNQNSGRKIKFKSAEELQEKIDNYFNSCFIPMIDKHGNVIHDNTGKIVMQQTKPFTMSGLADSLDTSRETLRLYEGKGQFKKIIEKAKRKCEVYAEERLFDKDGVNGAKFNLINNYDGWKEKQENVNINANTNYEEYIKRVESDEDY